VSGRRWLEAVRDEQAGSTLVLVPVAVILLLGLSALALDAAALYLGQRRIADLAAATATDAAGALDVARFYADPADLHLDAAAAQERANSLAASLGEDRTFEAVACELTVDGLTATATCEATVRPLLAPFWPGMDDALRLRVTEHAAALEG
jgi:hypothetical protein